MKSINEDNDVTTRDIILIVSMLGITLLSLLGLVNSLDESVCSAIWKMLSGDEIVKCFRELLGSILC